MGKRTCFTGINEKIVSLGAGYVFPGHRHPSVYETVIVLSGSLGVQFEKDTLYMQKDDFLLLPRGEWHVFFEAAKPARYYNCFFSGESGLLDNLSNKKRIISLSNYAKERVWKDVYPPETLYREDKIFFKAFSLLENVIRFGGSSTVPYIRRTGPSFQSKIEESIRDIIRENPGYVHNRSDLARIFCFEEHYFSSKIRKLTGSTVMELYYRQKIELARELLQKGVSAKEAAYYHGFSTPSHFSRKFKEITGHSPGYVSPANA